MYGGAVPDHENANLIINSYNVYDILFCSEIWNSSVPCGEYMVIYEFVEFVEFVVTKRGTSLIVQVGES